MRIPDVQNANLREQRLSQRSLRLTTSERTWITILASTSEFHWIAEGYVGFGWFLFLGGKRGRLCNRWEYIIAEVNLFGNVITLRAFPSYMDWLGWGPMNVFQR
ncbi:MAG: hypothetical protein ACTS5A_01565 [Candidatus Hodgkinia cicadicola]